MNTTTSSIRTKGSRPAQKKGMPLDARIVLRFLEHLGVGRLHVELPSGSRLAFGPGGDTAEIVFHDWRAFGRILRDGDIGFAEGFLEQQWHTPDLTGLLILLAANRKALDAPMYGSIAGRLIHRIAHWLRPNTRAGSRRNIAAHYDLGNDFYSLWLDPGMTYSSALFEAPGQTLEAAQRAKYQRILDQVALPAGSHILEIGAGWGGFAELAAAGKCRVTGLTLSREQLEYARERLSSRGYADRTAIEFRDYRDESGTYDAVVSIEMFEAVGERWWPAYFGKVSGSLRTGGKAVIQSIVIDEALFERYRKGSDFIQQYIFPGGMLASPTKIRALARQAGFEVREELRFGEDYGRTLSLWRERFMAQADSVRALGFDDRFMRMWEFYFAYCEAGFASGSTDVMQFTLVKK